MAAEPMDRVLIVDDDAFDRMMLADAIAALGRDVAVEERDDGRAALADVERLRPTVVALDLDMPAFDGFAFLEAAARLAAAPRIVVVTTSQRAEDHARARAAGAADVVVKPTTLAGCRAAALRVLDGA